MPKSRKKTTLNMRVENTTYKQTNITHCHSLIYGSSVEHLSYESARAVGAGVLLPTSVSVVLLPVKPRKETLVFIQKFIKNNIITFIKCDDIEFKLTKVLIKSVNVLIIVHCISVCVCAFWYFPSFSLLVLWFLVSYIECNDKIHQLSNCAAHEHKTKHKYECSVSVCGCV